VKKRKLFFLTHEFFPYLGGISTYVEETATQASKDFSVTVWAPAHRSIREKKFPFQVQELPWKGTRLLKDYARLALKVNKEKEQLEGAIVCLPEIGGILSYMLLGLFGMYPAQKLVLVLHGGEILKLSKGVFRKHFLQLLGRADRIGVVSSYVESLLLSLAPFTKEKIRLVPGSFRSGTPTPVRRRREEGVVRLLTVARIHERKGQLEVLKALSKLPPSVLKRCSYTLVGPVVSRSYSRALEKWAGQHNLPVAFKKALSEEELQDEYAQSDIFILASMIKKSSVEGLGLVFLEAALHHLPSIAYDSGGVKDAVTHEKTGLLVREGDLDALSACIKRLIEERELRESYGENAFEACKRFSWEKNVSELF
jgi:phosphatidylinositol alpha-1,6-mannosyltransferase